MDLLDILGKTPLVSAGEVEGNKLYAKIEYYNPSGSVKDRAAYYMIIMAKKRGLLKDGGVIIEPTSGNTGIGLAFIGARMGYKVILTLPENMSMERRQILAGYGAQLVLTPASEGMKGAIAKAEELVASYDNAFMPNQFSNPDNALAHYETTAPEIFDAVDADYIVAGIGSGGTVTGIGEYIRDNKLDAKVVGVEPQSSALLNGGKAGAHKIQGIGANFIPSLLNRDVLDRVQDITDEEALQGAKDLAEDFGIIGGISAGAAYIGACKLASKVKGKNIVFIVPDSAYKYLSNNIYG